MEERLATPALQEFPQLQRLAMFNDTNQGLIADYLAYLRARHYAPSVLEGTIRALKSFAVLTPAARQALLYQDLAQTPPQISMRGSRPPSMASSPPAPLRPASGSCRASLASYATRAASRSRPSATRGITFSCRRICSARWARTRWWRFFG